MGGKEIILAAALSLGFLEKPAILLKT